MTAQLLTELREACECLGPDDACLYCRAREALEGFEGEMVVITATLRDTSLVWVGDGYVLNGAIEGDTRKRFPDGEVVRTSRIVGFDNKAKTVTTRNSIYRVLPWRDLMHRQCCEAVIEKPGIEA